MNVVSLSGRVAQDIKLIETSNNSHVITINLAMKSDYYKTGEEPKNKIIATTTISIGSLSASVVHPREVFAEAIKYPCASIILVHNHPSGDPTPSREDIAVTERLVKAGKVMDIPVLDHIIIGNKKYCSLKEKGNMG